MKRQIFTLIMACVLLGAPAAWAQCDTYSKGIDEFPNSRIEGTVRLPDGSQFPFAGDGPFTVARGTPFVQADGRCVLPTQIVDFNIVAQTPFGEVMVTTYPGCATTDPDACDPQAGCSCGLIMQQVSGRDFPADSFFDVSLQVQSGVLPPLCNCVPGVRCAPARVNAQITDIPPAPGENYAEQTLQLLSCKTGIPANILIQNPLHRPYGP